jgi:hypothetical protein
MAQEINAQNKALTHVIISFNLSLKMKTQYNFNPMAKKN